MNTVSSSSIGKKIREVREAEGLTRREFFELTGIPIKTQTFYETDRQEGVGSNILIKITNHERFKKYTMWLLNGSIAPEAGQIAPTLLESQASKVKSDGTAKNAEKVVTQISSQKLDMQAIISSLSNLDDDELKQLAKQLSRQGIMSLLDFLDPENQTLINLAGNRKQVALRLKSMSDEEFREILSKIEECDTLPKEDINDFIEKAS